MRKIVLPVVALVLLVMPLATGAQQSPTVHRVGLFHVGLDRVPPSLAWLRDALKSLGYEEGKNIRLDWRNVATEDAARDTANEFVRDRVDVIVAFEDQAVRAAKAATSDIPIVMLHATDPVADGFVQSLAKPGANLTGVAGVGDVPVKRLQVFKELHPRLRRLLVLIDPEDPATSRLLPEVERAAEALGIKRNVQEARNQADIERIFGGLKRRDVDGVYVVSRSLGKNFSAPIVRLALAKRIPVSGDHERWAEQGALFSYAHHIAGAGQEAAGYIDKVLKGARPADLPVGQKFELVVNLVTANALGVKVPDSMLLTADRLIDPSTRLPREATQSP